MENTASKCMPEYDTFLIKALLFTSVLIESVLLEYRHHLLLQLSSLKVILNQDMTAKSKKSWCSGVLS